MDALSFPFDLTFRFPAGLQKCVGEHTRRLGSRRSAEGHQVLPAGKGDFAGAQVAKSAGTEHILLYRVLPKTSVLRRYPVVDFFLLSLCKECLFLRISKGNYIILIIINAYISRIDHYFSHLRRIKSFCGSPFPKLWLKMN